jgi:hypothetical protein
MRVFVCVQELTAKAVPQQTRGKKDQIKKIVFTEEGNGKVSVVFVFLRRVTLLPENTEENMMM